jgi:hypothetical protein
LSRGGRHFRPGRPVVDRQAGGLNASLLKQNTVVELLKGKLSICPLGAV